MSNPFNYRFITFKILIHHINNDSRLYESIDKYLKYNNISQRDKNLIIYSVQGVVRNLSSIDFILSSLINKYLKSIPLNIKTILRIGVFQIKHMNLKNYAIINELVEISKKQNIVFSKLVNAVLRKTILFNLSYNENNLSEEAKFLNHPGWLYKKWIEDHNKSFAKKLIKWNNNIPTIWFRVNTVLYSKNDFEYLLNKNKIKFNAYKYNKLYYKTSNPSFLLNNKIFKTGKITIQNPFSGFVCKLLNPLANEIIIDACASPGGKTAYISELMENKGKIYAYDLNAKRISLLDKTLDRMKITNVETKIKDVSSEKIKYADKILLDVPCTGTGVLNKYPDIKWRKSNKNLNEMISIQNKILQNTSKYLKLGGIIVYSTCSIEREENNDVINNFLKNNRNFSIVKIEDSIPKAFINKLGQFNTIPFIDEIDGGYATVLIKNDK